MPQKLQCFVNNFHNARIGLTSLSISSRCGRLRFMFLVPAIFFLLLRSFNPVHIKDNFHLLWRMVFITLSSFSSICKLKGDNIARYFDVVSLILYFDTSLPTVNLKLLLVVYISSFIILTYRVDGYFNSPLNCPQICNKYIGDVFVVSFLYMSL